MQEAEVVKVEDGVNHPKQCNVSQVKKRVQTGWSGCRCVAGGICGKKPE